MKEKPSKKIYGLLIIASAIIISAFIFRNGNPFTTTEDGTNLVHPSNTSVETLTTLEDTDGDGLFDWEEILRGTDPKAIDTDKDGTSDFDEVKQSRNPLISGPDDISEAVDTSINLNNNETTKTTNLKTVTSELSKNLLTKLISLKQDGELSQENKEKIISELTALTKQSVVYKKYIKETLLIIPNATTEDIRTYASNIATVQMYLIGQIAEKGEMIINNVDVLSNLYKDTAKKVSEIAVPEIFSDLHLIIVNNYSIVSESLLVFKEDFDPAKKAAYIGAYQQAVANQTQALNVIANYLKQNGILFTADQVGNYWNNF